MELKFSLELLGSSLNFVGGVVLTWDVLMVRRRILSERGIQDLQNRLTRAGEPDILTFEGRPLREQINIQLLLAEKPLVRARIGLGLLTAGFLLDFLGKLAGES